MIKNLAFSRWNERRTHHECSFLDFKNHSRTLLIIRHDLDKSFTDPTGWRNTTYKMAYNCLIKWKVWEKWFCFYSVGGFVASFWMRDLPLFLKVAPNCPSSATTILCTDANCLEPLDKKFKLISSLKFKNTGKVFCAL